MPLALLFGFAVTTIIVGTLFNSRTSPRDLAYAQDAATTTVTVTNVAPIWSTNAEENPASSTGTPTNVGSDTRWLGTGTDSNDEPYYMIVCSTSTLPVASSTGAPWCVGGTIRWGVSALTPSGQVATATRTAVAGDVELNEWWAFICDENDANPACNLTAVQGNGDFDASSPFYVNHRPIFNFFYDNSPQDPGLSVTWTASSVDYDVVVDADTVQLFVCKANDFTGSACGAGGTYCTSSLVSSSPTCAFALEYPKPDGNYTAFGFVLDNHGFAVSGGSQGTDSVLTVNNVAPTIAAASISLNDSDASGPLTLLNEAATTTGFNVKFTVADGNSCVTTASTSEITTALINVYRSGVGYWGCINGSQFDANSCYAASATGSGTWRVFSGADKDAGGICNGSDDDTQAWTSTFTLWYVADPTDGSTASDSAFFAEDWLNSVAAFDDQSASSNLIELLPGNARELQSFLAVDLRTPTIAYGSLAPGQNTEPLSVTTVLAATGNVGLDQSASGSHMCVPYPNCSGSATDTIHVFNQHYTATAGTVFTNGIILTSTTSPELEVNGRKSTATSHQQTASSYWGILVPITITQAGDYTGQNTIYGIKSEGSQW